MIDFPEPRPLPIPFPGIPPLEPFPFSHWCGVIVRDLDCKTRILMVTDGLNFGTGGFGLSEAVSIVKAASTTDHPIEVVTASTGGDPAADVTGFTFAGTHVYNGDTRTIQEYQEIWLFASGSAAPGGGMQGAELAALVTFMDNGGGILAMGDHGSLGAQICGEIPRVKSMRQWYSDVAPTMGGQSRIDTNVPSSYADPQFDLQSDNIPQRIYPTWYGDPSLGQPHALLSFAGGTVAYLPDHPHEGRCVIPAPLDPVEWPNDGAGTQVPPEIVAHGVSAGPGFSGGKPSITPPVLFGVIGAYDGHRTGKGRIVVDSTWHHWININLNGSGAMSADGLVVDGLYDGAGNPTPEYLQIQAYYQNIAGWLEPNRLRICWILILIPCLRWEWPLFQEIDLGREFDLPETLRIGKLTIETIRRIYGDVRASEVSQQLVQEIGDCDPDLVAMFHPDPKKHERSVLPPFFNSEVFSAAVVGGAVLGLAHAVPENPNDGVEALRKIMSEPKSKKLNHDKLGRLLSDGSRKGLSLLAKEIRGSTKALDGLQKMMANL